MPIDATAVAKAAEENAKKLGLSDEPSEEIAAEEPVAAEEKKTEPSEEEEEEELGDEAEPDEEEPSKKSKTVPMERFNKVYGKLKNLERAMEYVLAQRENIPAPAPEETPKPAQLPDFEQMTNKDLVLWVLDNLGKKVETTIKKEVEPLRTETRQEKADRDVAACMGRHSDYLDYARPMVQIANRYPTLDAESVYILAKGGQDARETAKTLAKKAKEKIDLKKKARVEKRSSPSEKQDEKTSFKNVREAGLAVAEKLGLK